MIQMILSPEQEEFLANAQEPVEIVDRRGRVLMRVAARWTDAEIEEIERKGQESGLATESIFELTERLRRDYPVPSK